MLGMGGIVSASERGSGLTAELPDDCSRHSQNSSLDQESCCECLEHGGMTVFSWLLEPAETLARKSHVMVAPLVVSTSFDEPPPTLLESKG